MDESVVDVHAQLKLCEEQHARNIFEIAKLETVVAEMQPELDALRASSGDGGKLHADYRQLRKVYHAHVKWAGSCQEPSQCLLLFYAIECGLKCVYMRRNKLQSTKQLADRGLLRSYGHDLARWSKELRMPALPTNTSVQFRLMSDMSKTCHIDKAHEAWRYGVVMESESQGMLVRWLVGVSEWIKPQLGDK